MYKVERTFLNFVVGDEVEQERLEKIFHESYIETLIKDGFLLKGSKPLPKKWEDLKEISGYYVGERSLTSYLSDVQTHSANKNIFPTQEEAEACVALAQLCQLRDVYNEGWKPNYTDGIQKAIVHFSQGHITWGVSVSTSKVLIFKTIELRNKFLDNFKDIIEIAKPLL